MQLYNVIIFILKQQSKMIKINKNSSKSKAISSYILSGINIKRMLHDQMNTDCNVSDINIIRLNRRPIFKIKQREKQNTNLLGALPNKSFKIRSYTKKTKEGDKDQTQIFQKLQKFRNGRANSNRIDIFNMSKQVKGQKDQIEYKIESKIKQILQREASIKCKVSNQVFVKQVCQKNINNICIDYQQFNTERYRQIAHKINVYFNPKFQTNTKILLIVSVQALHVHSKRVFKSNNQSYEQYHNVQKQPNMSDQQIEVLKMFSSKYYSNWQRIKIAFKVNNAQQLTELRHLLEVNHINDYYCIFYPIKKYVESLNLYQIDGLIQQVSSIIVLQSKFKVKAQFPIVNSFVKMLFVITNNDNLVGLSRTVSGIKCFVAQTIRQLTYEKDNLLMIVDDVGEIQEKSLIKQQRVSQNKQQISNSFVVSAQFNLKQQLIQINLSELQAKLEFTLNSRELKAYYNHNRNHNQSTCTEKQIKIKRRTLCERQNNYPFTACKNRIVFNSNSHEKWNIQINQQGNLQKIKEKLLNYMKSQSNGDSKNVRKLEHNDKADEVDQISNYLKGGCKSKTNHQIVSQLVKKNTITYKQIEQYLHKTANLNTNYQQNNVQVSAFNSRQFTDESQQHQEEEKPTFCIKAYKIL